MSGRGLQRSRVGVRQKPTHFVVSASPPKTLNTNIEEYPLTENSVTNMLHDLRNWKAIKIFDAKVLKK